MTATTPGKTNQLSLLAKVRGRVVDALILGALAFAALLVHGYHPFAEDAAIYVPAIKKDLHPSLYPWGSEFFTSHGRMTLFDNIVAASVKATHLQVDMALLLWHLLCIFLLFAASLLLSEQICTKRRHRWTAVGLIGSVLTVPVAGTALLMMDPYLNPRSLSTPLALFAITAVLTRRHLLCALCLAAIAPVHPLMTVYAAALCGIILLNRMNAIQTAWGSLQAAASRLKLAVGLEWAPATACALVLPMCLFALGSHLPSTDAAYSDALVDQVVFLPQKLELVRVVGRDCAAIADPAFLQLEIFARSERVVECLHQPRLSGDRFRRSCSAPLRLSTAWLKASPCARSIPSMSSSSYSSVACWGILCCAVLCSATYCCWRPFAR